jgi:hypothetical protein
LDIDRYYRYCYQKVLAEPYFTARRELNLIFSWRRQENVIQNYQQNTYYLGPERLSGYVANSRGILLDIWARSAHAAESALSSVSAQLDPIVIHNQIQDAVLTFLVHHSIQPVTVHHEMIWHLKKLESNNLQIGSISWT